MESTQVIPPPPAGPPRRREEISPPRETPERNGNGAHAVDSKPQQHDDWGEVNKPKRGAMLVTAIVAGVLIVGLFLTGFIPRTQQNAQLEADAQAERDSGVPVNVAQPVPSKADVEITVPGTLRPEQETSIFARTTGYLGKWSADISNHVKKGELMATIDAPDVDQQLSQAQAALAQLKAAVEKAESDLLIAQQTYARFESLKGSAGVTQQELDQYYANQTAAKASLDSAKANVEAGEANVKRLSDLQSFEKIIAPFDGVVTGRAYDTGAMIIADPTDVNTKPIYKIAENDVLRVFVNVPQSSALSIKQFMPAKVTVRERPGKVFSGQVLGTTNYLDPGSRALLTEVKVPNQSGELLPGMFVNVTFDEHRDKTPLLVPGPALIQSADGNQVAIIQDGKAHFVPVKLGIDYGATIEVTEGLNGDEQIIANPGERVVEGVKVRASTPSQSDRQK
jgi:RND family efflux transporter MFP subunit